MTVHLPYSASFPRHLPRYVAIVAACWLIRVSTTSTRGPARPPVPPPGAPRHVPHHAASQQRRRCISASRSRRGQTLLPQEQDHGLVGLPRQQGRLTGARLSTDEHQAGTRPKAACNELTSAAGVFSWTWASVPCYTWSYSHCARSAQNPPRGELRAAAAANQGSGGGG
jgi:hypothetical protein